MSFMDIYGYLWMTLGLMLPAMGELEILYYIQGKHVILRLVPVIYSPFVIIYSRAVHREALSECCCHQQANLPHNGVTIPLK